MEGGRVLVFPEVGTMKSLHWRCERLFDCVERKRLAKLPLSTTASCAFATALSFQACLRACICTFCMCVCIYAYVCTCADMYICIYMHVCMYLYIYAFIHMCMCMCMRICAWIVGLGISVQRVDGVMHAHVFSCTYVCVCVCVWACIYVHFFAVSVTCTLQVFWALVHGQVCMLHRSVFTPTYTSANTLAAGCAHMRICMYVCICMHMHMDAYVCL